MRTIFLRALEADDKSEALRSAIWEPEAARGKQRFELDAVSFAAVPRSPFAYWVSDRLRSLFGELQHFEAGGRCVLGGLKTLSDERFVRLWWELPVGAESLWPGLEKGGAFSRFYADVYLRVNWRTEGQEISWYGYQRRPREGFGAASRGAEAYFRPGLTWPRRTQGGLSLRAMPAGCIFGDKGPAAFVETDDDASLLTLLAVVNSAAFRALVDLQMAFGSYEVGVIQRTPIPSLRHSDQSTLAKLSRRAWSLKRRLDNHTETSHAMMLPALLQVAGDDLRTRANAAAEQVQAITGELTAIQAEIDTRCFDLYDISEGDRRAIAGGFSESAGKSDDAEHTDADDDADDEGETENSIDIVTLAAELVSWAVGVAFGRFDVRLATGVRPLPEEPEPFDALPVCSPAMLSDDDGLPLMRLPAGYSITFPENGLLVDDRGHTRDLTTAVRMVFDEVFKSNADSWWNEVGALLDSKDYDLRKWLAWSFFEHHLKRYSKSRRKAPILWQLSVPSGRYSVWVYAHRLNRDSVFHIQNDVVMLKLTHEERQLASLVQSAGAGPPAKERKEIAEQGALVGELRSFLEEVKRVAPLWKPVLDDGVLLTMAPFWRLVPRHKPWQNELKSKLDELAAGKYDWSHTAMHLWPERVIPKCAADHSLAIAHGLEDAFWTEGSDGKWEPRSTPTRPIDDLVRERTSVAVKAALKNLLEAPVVSGTGSRVRALAEVIS